MELARVLRRFARPPAIVFVTAYDDRAVDAFDLGAADYVRKPVRPERLAESLRRVLAAAACRAGAGAGRGRRTSRRIPVELAGTTRMLPRSAVRWVEAQGDYARLHTADGVAPGPGVAGDAGRALGGRRLRPHPPVVPGRSCG